MKTLEKNKGLLAAIVIFALAMFFYRSFFKLDIEAIYVDSSARSKGAALIETRAKLQAVKFDSTLFSRQTYQLLNDFSIPIPDQPLGRPNPFDALGSN